MPTVTVAGSLDPQNVRTFAGCVGIRGPWGPQISSALLPGYPASFDGTIGSGGTWTDFAAFNAAGGGVTDGKYRVFGTHTSPPTVTYKSGQQFWGDPASPALLTFAAGTNPMFTDGGANKPNAKFMNMAFVGFRSQIRVRASGGAEVAYCDLSAENGVSGTGCVDAVGQSATPGAWIHHNRIHDTGSGAGPIGTFQSYSGILIEDNEFANILGSDGWKVAVGTRDIVVRHNWCHDFASSAEARGIWYDYWNAGAVVEWNLIERCGMGIEMEANPGRFGLNTAAGPWLTEAPFTDPTNPFSVIRYNSIRNCRHGGIFLAGCVDHDVYGNDLYRNQTDQQIGIESEIRLMLTDQEHRAIGDGDGQGTDLKDNYIHDNLVEVHPAVGGHQPKRAASTQIIVAPGTWDPTPYQDNSKNNDWDLNNYKLNRVITTGDTFLWDGSGARSWAQWQALPQDVNSVAVE